MNEKEYYRTQHRAAISQLEATAEESSTLRTKYSELVADKQRMDREISELRSNCCNQPVRLELNDEWFMMPSYRAILIFLKRTGGFGY